MIESHLPSKSELSRMPMGHFSTCGIVEIPQRLHERANEKYRGNTGSAGASASRKDKRSLENELEAGASSIALEALRHKREEEELVKERLRYILDYINLLKAKNKRFKDEIQSSIETI